MRLTALLGVVAIFLVGCSSNVDSHKYYKFSLNSENSPAKTSESSQRVYIDTISILGAANQQALVQYTDENQINIANFHYWAEHPKNMLMQATHTYLVNEGIYAIPLAYAGDELEQHFTLKIVVHEFAGHFTKGAVLKGNWYLYQHHKRNKTLRSSSAFSLSNSLEDDGFESLVAAHKNNWLLLMQGISQQINPPNHE
ncbi:PqiC family protein [Pseudoalteromonas luteoviolacea]|uniref:ABC-type transport auxiliary lipoprotein component domain-containing protein n=1 Tax=Pseudoalteromonas luteoviolacea S4060-1 TaxID=1365257 RepID=A0A167P1V5_9GAMM|nr:ABC-type transport auxiliary lipoprotein family protein [Pseudoalteromonas luteoviolacea]KZN69306.1 hypothetical protein N478_11780 [Pseudoalteromonas luteoviolacea S4060-1]